MNLELAQNIVERTLKKGCDSAEVYIREGRGISVAVKGREIEAMEASKDYGLALKVIKKQRLGFAYTSSRETTETVIEEAIQSADWTSADEYISVPEKQSPSKVLIFDGSIHNVSEDEIIRNALMLEESAMSVDKRIKKVRKAEIATGSGTTTIASSSGISFGYDSTYFTASITTLAQDNSNDSQMGWDYRASRRMKDIDIALIGATAAKRALELLGSRKISSVKVPVILCPSVAIDFLEILSVSLSAEAVQKKRSFLMDKTGQVVTSRSIDIIDDGTMDWAIGTKPVDDEGVPALKKTMIEQGRLNGYLHNTYTARKAGVRSTGNAARGNYKNLPGIGTTNLYLRSSHNTYNSNLAGSINRGILIVGAMGVHTANPISGDFSIGISGLWIEKGEVLYPVKEAVVSGNILEMFKKIEDIGNDLTFYGNIGSPSLLIGDMDISA